MTRIKLFITMGVCLFCVSLLSFAVDTEDTRLLSQPALSGERIVFMYSGDLWVTGLDGTDARRLTSHRGTESNAVFSPDGKIIAFSGEYDGNTDVYTVPAEGGIPKRLTWHPGEDIVRGFTPDGKSVVFISSRFAFSRANSRPFRVPLEGGFPEPLPLHRANKLSYSPDGSKLAYTPLPEAFRQWKNYRGGTVSLIWLYSLSDRSQVKIPQPEGRCNDTDPMWIGNKVYFLSDRNGEFNLFAYDTETREIDQLTRHDDFPILSASAGGGQIIYEQAGYLHLFNPATSENTRLVIGVAADLKEIRPRYVKGFRYIRHADISPTGVRAVLEFRGEIISVPAEKGDPRNLTQSPGVHERSPAWSPDGKHIAYFSDESGEYMLHIIPQDGEGKAKKFTIPEGAGFYDSAVWSPDGEKISFVDNSWTLFWIDTGTGEVTEVSSEHYYGPAVWRGIDSAWSPDSRWIAYTLNTKAYMQQVYVYSLDQNKSFPMTEGMSEVSNPVFDENGKYLYFFASTNAGPVKHWFAMSSADMRMSQSLYLVVLQKGVMSPLAKESDEEIGTESNPKSEKRQKIEGSPQDKEQKAQKEIIIDFEGLSERILSFPLPEGNYFLLQSGAEGQVYYLEASPLSRGPFDPQAKLHHYDLSERKGTVILEGIAGYDISADNTKILYMTQKTLGIIPARSPAKPGQGKIDTDAVEVRIEPRAEWDQIFFEAWRINRDYFYDPHMHGADWKAMKAKYAAFLPHLSSRSDLNRVIQWMCSELAVGHHRVGGGDTLTEPERIPGGLLGADYEIADGRFRFAKVFGGLNWNPELRSPLTEPGVDVKEGEYLLAVQGEDVRAPENVYRFFENTAEKLVQITVGPSPDGEDSRTVSVVPVPDERALRNRDWVEGNLVKVDKATGGRVAYVYVPNTTTLGHVYFKRYFFPQVDKDAIIVDERFNGGGQVADYYIDLLRRPFICYWHTRYGADLRTPSAAIFGPKVMLINETAGSGGDLLPWMFRKLKLGKLIGKRTWGGLVGTLGFPILMDGGYVTAPNLAIWTEEGWVVENVGVPPDIEVEQWPADVMAGKDPQLEKAIEVVLKELETNPPREMPSLPPFPERALLDEKREKRGKDN